MTQQQNKLDPSEELNKFLQDLERDNAQLFAPPSDTPPLPCFENEFSINNDIPTLPLLINGEQANSPSSTAGSLKIPGSYSVPPVPPPSFNISSPLAAGITTTTTSGNYFHTDQVMALNTPTTQNGTNYFGGGFSLTIVEQPVERCRFRYKAEQGPHGALRGVSGRRQKSSPKVKVDGIRGHGYVVASLWTNEEIPRPHVNELWGAECENGLCKVHLDANMTASFPNLGIMRQKEKEVGDMLYEKYIKEYETNNWTVTDDIKESLREKSQKEMATMKDCLHCVRVGFQGFITDPNNRQLLTPIVLSSPVYNSQNPGFSELRIAELDKSYGSCLGGDTVWMRCAAKIRRDQIKIKFHEPSTGWEADATFSPSEVYEQILVIFKTPPYRDTNICGRTNVNIHLFRITDNEYSAPVDFIYLPVNDGPVAKRQRLTVPYGSPEEFSSGSYAPFNGATPGAPSTSPHDSSSSSNSPNTYQWTTQHLPSSSQSLHHFRKRHLPSSASLAKPVQSLDSGIEVDAARSTVSNSCTASAVDEPLRTKIEELSLIEANRLNDSQKVQKYLSSMWEMHAKALWDFGTEGDPEPLVGACKHLIGLQDENGNTALHIAVRNKQPLALQTMLKVLNDMPNKVQIVNLQNFRKQTPLHLAVRYGEENCVHYLLKSGADRSILDCDGLNCVHYLADTFNEAIYKDVLFPPRETAHVDLDLYTNEGVTVLHLAIKRIKSTLIDSLLEAKASLSISERNTGKYPLHLAVEQGDAEVVDALLKNGAEPDMQMHDGTTTLQLAVKLKQEANIALLVAAGADINLKSCPSSQVEEETDQNDAEMLEGESSHAKELKSAIELASGDDNLTAFLNGKPYVPPSTEMHEEEPEDMPGPSTGARPKKSCKAKTKSKQQTQGMLVSASSESLPEVVPASLRDDLSSLDFVTRLRLSKLLDPESRWEQLSVALNCEHMIEFIKVCTEAEKSSPTILLLDQYEQLLQPTVSRLLNALHEIQLQSAIDLIIDRQNQQREQMERIQGQSTNPMGNSNNNNGPADNNNNGNSDNLID